MLYLKSKELKNSSKQSFINKGFSLFALNALGLYSPFLHAQDSTDFTSITQIASIFFSLIFVIAIIFGLAYLMRRFNVTQAGRGELKIVASLVAGTKERVIVVQVGDEQHLLGVTTHNINHLAHLSLPINTEFGKEVHDPDASMASKFTQVMAQAMNSSKEHK